VAEISPNDVMEDFIDSISESPLILRIIINHIRFDYLVDNLTNEAYIKSESASRHSIFDFSKIIFQMVIHRVRSFIYHVYSFNFSCREHSLSFDILKISR
jgi:hypothetical protein